MPDFIRRDPNKNHFQGKLVACRSCRSSNSLPSPIAGDSCASEELVDVAGMKTPGSPGVPPVFPKHVTEKWAPHLLQINEGNVNPGFPVSTSVSQKTRGSSLLSFKVSHFLGGTEQFPQKARPGQTTHFPHSTLGGNRTDFHAETWANWLGTGTIQGAYPKHPW